MEGLEKVKEMFTELEKSIEGKVSTLASKGGEEVATARKELEVQLQEIRNKVGVIEGNIATQKATELPGVDGEKFSFAKWAALSYYPELETVKEFGYENEVRREMQKRNVVASDGSSGGYTVPTSLADYIVKPAIENMPLRSLGVTVLDNVRGVLEIPSLEAKPATGHSAENGVPTKATFTFGIKRMTPKRAAGYTFISRRVLRDSPLSVEQYVRDQLMLSLMAKMEYGCIAGKGADNEPTGLLNYPGMSDLSAAITGQVTVKQLSQMKTDLDEVDFGEGNEAALIGGNFGFLTRPIVAEGIRMARTTFYSGQTSGKGFQINNAPITNQVLADTVGAKIAETTLVPKASDLSSIVYGNWRHAIMALWSGLEVRASDSASDGTTHAMPQGMVMIVADQDYDFCLDLPAAFVKTATASALRSAWTEY